MTVGVYGLGRFGFFWAHCLSTVFEVKAYNRTPKRQKPSSVEIVSFEELVGCDVVFLTVAISAIEDVVKSIAPRLKPGALVIDTCSVKVYPVEVMRSHLPENVEILGCHPMFGPDSAKTGLNNLPIILSRVRVSEEKYRVWINTFEELGLSVIEMAPEDHDREAANTQGITHFIGRVLKDLDLAKSEIATLGYKKILEVIEQTCNDPFQLFMDLQQYNPYTQEMRMRLKTSLDKMLRLLEQWDYDSLSS